MKNKFYISLVTLFLFIAGIDDSMADFEFSSFDPAGELCNKLQDKAPKLEISGFINNKTDLDLHGKKSDTEKGHINRDWNFQMIEWDVQLESRYRFSDYLELINVNRFLYDSLYDWDKNAHFSHSVKYRLEHYDSFKQIMSEFYFNYINGGWFLKLGKQQVVWGKMDGKCIDIINPQDSRESVNGGQDDYEWRKIPTWMTNATYFWSDYYIQFIWIPDFEPSLSPPRGSVWWYPAVSPTSSYKSYKKDKPAKTFENQEFAIRFNMVKNGWDSSLIYFYTWDDYPTMFNRDYWFNPVTGENEQYREPKYTRLHQFGFNVDKGNWFLGRNWVWRMEFLYTLNDYVRTEDPSSHDGAVKRNHLKSISSIETNWLHGRLTTLLQYSWKYNFGYDSDFRSLGSKLKRYDPAWLFSMSRKWFSNRLQVTTTFYYRPGEGSWKFKDTLSWAFSDYFSAQVRYTGFTGPSDDIYGMYDKWDNLGFEFKYNF